MSSRRLLTQHDGNCEWRDRRDSNPKSNSDQVFDSKMLEGFTKEQWAQIWTHIFGEDGSFL